MTRVEDELREPKRYGAEPPWRERRADAMEPRERREGPSWLSTRSGRQLLLMNLGWVASMGALVGLGALTNILIEHSTEDVRLMLTRSNLIGLVAAVLFPPVCLTTLWWRIHRRRHSPRAARH